DGQAIVLQPDGPTEGDAIKVPGFPAIVESELFRAVQMRLAEAPRRSRKKGAEITALTGLCRCSACEGHLSSCNSHGHAYYRCLRPEHSAGPFPCNRSYRRRDELVRKVLDVLGEKLLKGDAMANVIQLATEAEGDARTQWEASMQTVQQAISTCSA